MSLFDRFLNGDIFEPSPIEQRQNRQWKLANDCLKRAQADNITAEGAAAWALIGLLANELSQR